MVQVTNLETNRTSRPRPILVTGGAGFIGANFIIDWLAHEQLPVVNLDKLTYAGNLANLRDVEKSANYEFVKGDIVDSHFIKELFTSHHFDGISLSLSLEFVASHDVSSYLTILSAELRP